MSPEGASFIPKSGVKAVHRTRSTHRIYVLAYISYIVFFSTLFAVIGVYVYGVTVDRSLSSLREQLITEQKRFSVSDIEEVKQLDNRLTIAERLLEESSAPSRLFTDIESIVSSNIYFSGMIYERMPSRQFKVQLIGRANNFTDVIGQRQLLGNSNLLREATVVDYDYSVGGEGGQIGDPNAATLTFIFSDTRDLSTIAYTPAQSNFQEAPSNEEEDGAVIIGEPIGTTSTSTESSDDSNSSAVDAETENETDTGATSTTNQTSN